MNDPRPNVVNGPPVDVPVLTDVLTEVLVEPAIESVIESAIEPLPQPVSSGVVLPLRAQCGVEPPPAQDGDIDQDALIQEVLADVQRQVNGLYAYRIRDSLNPLLDKLVQDLVGAAREELASTVHDIVRKAVAQALARRRNQGAGR